MTTDNTPNTNSADIDQDFEALPPGESFQGAPLVQRLKEKLATTRSRFGSKLDDLTFSQWMYFIAFMSLFFTFESDQETTDSLLITGIIAGLGLIRELWQLFMRIWAHTAGKGLLFVLYAATANFALAISALKINSISGVEPTAFVFTMGFTTLLMLPFWLILASMVFLGTALVFGNIWLLLAGLLRIVKIRLPMHWEDKSFAVLTLILRIILIPALIWALANMLNPYLKQMDMFDEPINFTVVNPDEISAEDLNRIRELPRGEMADALELARKDFQLELAKERLEVASSEELAELEQAVQQLTEEREEIIADAASPDDDEETLKWLDIMIARFIFRFEAYPYSACAKEPQQRVLTINEELLFVAERDSSQPLGIKFSATECVPRNSDHQVVQLATDAKPIIVERSNDIRD